MTHHLKTTVILLLCWISTLGGAHVINLERRHHVSLAKRAVNPPLEQPQSVLAHLFGKRIEEALEEEYKMIYVGKVTIGRPALEYALIFDTGSSDIWYIPSAEQALPTQQLSAPIEIQYGIGEVIGSFWAEQLCLEAHPATLCGMYPVMLPEKVGDLDGVPADGILGLGLSGVAHTGVCYVESLRQVYRQPAMGVALGDQAFIAFDELRAQLDMAQEVTGCPATEAAVARVVNAGLPAPGWWAVEGSLHAATLPETSQHGIIPAVRETLIVTLLTTLSLGLAWMAATSARIKTSFALQLLYLTGFGLLFCGVVMPSIDNLVEVLFCFRGSEVALHAPMLLDSGTSLLVIPRAEATNVATALLGVYSSTQCSWSNNILLCFCDVGRFAAPLRVSIGGVVVEINGEDLFTETNSSGVCYSGLQVGEGQFILGDVFLRSVYVVHDIVNTQVHVFPRRGRKSSVEALDARQVRKLHGLPLMTFTSALLVLGATVVGVAAVIATVLRRQSKGVHESYHSLAGEAGCIPT